MVDTLSYKNFNIVKDLVPCFSEKANQVKDLHWNVVGIDFLPVHEFLGELYDELIDYQDKIAEKCKLHFGPVSGQVTKLAKPFDSFYTKDVLGYTRDILEYIKERVAEVYTLVYDIKALTKIFDDLDEYIDTSLYKINAWLAEGEDD